MSFSVHARSFVPSKATALSPSHLHESAAGAGACSTTKDCVCVAFYENGRCPYGNHCEHAHRFSELTVSTQAKLLTSVPAESIPAHFFGSSGAKGEMLAALDGAAALPSAAFAYGMSSHYSPVKSAAEAERTVSTRRRPPGKDRPLVVSRTAAHASSTHDSASTSSRASSSAGSQRGGGGAALAGMGSGTSSPLVGHAAAAVVEEAGAGAAFKLHLPLRCRYPHRTIPGTYYDVLALPRDASPSDIMAKYRAWQKDGFKRMRLVDPVGAEAVDRMIVEARNVLGHPALRAAYDQQLPSVAAKAQPWAVTPVAHAGTASSLTTPSKRCTQGQSSATSSSASESHQRVESSVTRLGCSSSSSSIYHADGAVPVVSISSLRNGDSIW